MNPPTPTQEEIDIAAEFYTNDRLPEERHSVIERHRGSYGFLAGVRWLQEWNEKHATAYKPDLIRDSVLYESRK